MAVMSEPCRDTPHRRSQPLDCRYHGQGEVKRSSAVGSVRGPQSPAVGCDDGSADGEAQAQALLLRREERLENLLELVRIDTSSTIENRCLNHTMSRIELSHYLYPTIARWICAHRLAGIQDQIQEYLLQFHSITLYRGDELIDARTHLHVALSHGPAHQRQYVAQKIIYCDTLQVRFPAQQ
jgi:hypothetical protein